MRDALDLNSADRSDISANEMAPSRRARGTLAITVGVVVALAGWHLQSIHSHASDFAQVWYGARALIAGDNPYDVVGPGRSFPWPFPLLYPLTALIVAIPFAAIPLRLANVLWVASSAALLAWGLSRERLGPRNYGYSRHGRT
jgi:hypothetical protein